MQICLFDYLGYSVCKASYIVNLEEAFLLFLDVMGHQQCTLRFDAQPLHSHSLSQVH
jgi:hypothetical protein